MILRRLTKHLLRISLLCVVLFLPQHTFAADVFIAPPLIDLEIQPRDVVTKDITIKNLTNRKIYVYATVNEIAVDDTGEIKAFVPPVMDDRTKSITSWVEITRGRIELEVGEETVVPVTIRVHPYAEAGEYHVFIGMVAEFNRPQAEARALSGDADGVIIKVSLADKSVDTLRILSYLVDRFVVRDEDRTISLVLKNEGSKTSTPSGEIIFYNSRGEETAFVPINAAGETIEPGADKHFAIQIPFKEKLGRYKANAVIRYGHDGASTIFDTTQFYMVPIKLLVLLFVGILLFSVLVSYLIRRVFYDELQTDEEQNELPLRVRNDREHITHDHDLHISKK